MRSFTVLVAFGMLFALIGSTSLLETIPRAYAQQCPNGVCR